MNWDEATALGAKAARLIEDLTLIFEQISEGGYVVTPPTWHSVEETQVRQGNTKRLVVMELDDHLRIAKVFEPKAVDGLLGLVGYKVPEGHTVVGSVLVRHEFDLDCGPAGGVEVPPDIGSGPTIENEAPRWVSVLDEHTCPRCRERHGRLWTEQDRALFPTFCQNWKSNGMRNDCRCLVEPPPKPEGPPVEEVHLGGKIRPNSNKAGG